MTKGSAQLVLIKLYEYKVSNLHQTQVIQNFWITSNIKFILHKTWKVKKNIHILLTFNHNCKLVNKANTVGIHIVLKYWGNKLFWIFVKCNKKISPHLFVLGEKCLESEKLDISFIYYTWPFCIVYSRNLHTQFRSIMQMM